MPMPTLPSLNIVSLGSTAPPVLKLIGIDVPTVEAVLKAIKPGFIMILLKVEVPVTVRSLKVGESLVPRPRLSLAVEELFKSSRLLEISKYLLSKLVVAVVPSERVISSSPLELAKSMPVILVSVSQLLVDIHSN